MDFVIYMVMLMDEKDMLLHLKVVTTDKTRTINYGSTGIFPVYIISHSLTSLSDKITN